MRLQQHSTADESALTASQEAVERPSATCIAESCCLLIRPEACGVIDEVGGAVKCQQGWLMDIDEHQGFGGVFHLLSCS